MSHIKNRTVILSGTANPILSLRISRQLEHPLGSLDIGKFSDGEIRCEIDETVRGQHTYVIQPTCKPTNDNIMELLIITDALRRSAAKSITAVVPYYGYARQDRRPDFTRTPITSRLVATMFEAAGIDQMITVDLHSGQQQGFFHKPVINISASPKIIADIWRNYGTDVVVVSPDVGGVVRARSIAKQLDDADLAIVDKRRPKANESKVMNVIGDVDGRDCIIVDDMIDTAGTLCKAAAALKERGAKKVAAYATHAVFSGDAYENIARSVLDEVVVTDTVPIREYQFPDADPDMEPMWSQKIRQISIADLIAETMVRIRSSSSVSAIYTGH